MLWLIIGLQAHGTRAAVASYKTATDRILYEVGKEAGLTTAVAKHRARRAKVLKDRRDRPEAIETWRALEQFYGPTVLAYPADYTSRYMLGEALFHQGKYEPALFHLLITYYGVDPRTDKELPTNDSLAREQAQRAFLLAQAFEQLGMLDEARFHYRETLKHEGLHAEAARRLAALGS